MIDWLLVSLVASTVGLFLAMILYGKLLLRAHKKIDFLNKKVMSQEYAVISKLQLEQMAKEASSAEELLEQIIALSEVAKRRKMNDSYKREYKVYEDDNFSIYQFLPNEFAIYSKDHDRSLYFSIEANKDVIMQEGIEYDTVEDVRISLDGQSIMTFDGRFI